MILVRKDSLGIIEEFELEEFEEKVVSRVRRRLGRAVTETGLGTWDQEVYPGESASIAHGWDPSDAMPPDRVPRLVFQLRDPGWDPATWAVQRLCGPGGLAVRPARWRRAALGTSRCSAEYECDHSALRGHAPDILASEPPPEEWTRLPALSLMSVRVVTALGHAEPQWEAARGEKKTAAVADGVRLVACNVSRCRRLATAGGPHSIVWFSAR